MLQQKQRWLLHFDDEDNDDNNFFMAAMATWLRRHNGDVSMMTAMAIFVSTMKMNMMMTIF